MHRLIFFALACFTIVMGTCHSTEHSGTCVPITGATRVVIQPGNVITDPVRVRDLIAFANARLKVSQPSLSTMPAPQVTAAFYNGTDFVGAIGSGSNFFFVSCSNWKGVREATAVEIGDFERLIGSADKKRTQR